MRTRVGAHIRSRDELLAAGEEGGELFAEPFGSNESSELRMSFPEACVVRRRTGEDFFKVMMSSESLKPKLEVFWVTDVVEMP